MSEQKPACGVWCVVAWLAIMGAGLATCTGGKEAKKAKEPREVVYNSPWDGGVRQVERWMARNLKDPDSFEAIEWGGVVKTDKGGFLVRVKYRAKNSFGGYGIDHKLFALSSKGEVLLVTDYKR